MAIARQSYTYRDHPGGEDVIWIATLSNLTSRAQRVEGIMQSERRSFQQRSLISTADSGDTSAGPREA